MMTLPFLTADPIDVGALEQKVRRDEPDAVVTFQGVVRRDRTGQGEIDHLLYEAYEPMAQKEMARILREMKARWPRTQAVLQHRVGRVNVGETSVFIAVSSPRRAQAFEACRYAMDRIKTAVPLWKKDVYTNGGSRWTLLHHETLLVSDTAVAIPES